MTDSGSVSEWVMGLLRNREGLEVGEVHQDDASLQFIRRMLPTFAASGVKTLGMEFLDTALNQEDLAIFNATGEIPQRLQHIIDYFDLDSTAFNLYQLTGESRYREFSQPVADPDYPASFNIKTTYGNLWFREWKNHRHANAGKSPADFGTPETEFIEALQRDRKSFGFETSEMMREAHRLGIRIDALNNSQLCNGEAIKVDHLRSGVKRLQTFNDHVVGLVDNHLRPRGKYVLWTGLSHASLNSGVPGLSERLGIPSVGVLSGIAFGKDIEQGQAELHDAAEIISSWDSGQPQTLDHLLIDLGTAGPVANERPHLIVRSQDSRKLHYDAFPLVPSVVVATQQAMYALMGRFSEKLRRPFADGRPL